MNSTETLIQIKSDIKREIGTKLLSNTHDIQGLEREFVSIQRWWRDGVELPKDFDLLKIIEQGTIEIDVEFNLWAIVKLDQNSKRTTNINGQFTGVTISWENKTFNVDTSNASFFNLQMS